MLLLVTLNTAPQEAFPAAVKLTEFDCVATPVVSLTFVPPSARLDVQLLLVYAV